MGRAIEKIVDIGLWLFFGVFLLIVLRGAITAEAAAADSALLFLGGIAAAGAVGVLAYILGRRSRQIGKALYVTAIAAMFAVMLLLQLKVGWGMRSDLRAYPPIYLDVQILDTSARELIAGQPLSEKWYFLQYTHQVSPLYFLAGIYKAAELVIGYVPMTTGIAANILLTDIGILFLILASQRIAGRKRTLTLMILLLLFAPLYTYMPFMYFDTMVLPFMTAPLYLYICFVQKRAKKRSTPFVWLALAGLLIGVGIALRRTSAIVLIAMALHLIWTYRDKVFRGIAVALAFAALAAAVLAAAGLMGERIISADEREAHAFPKTHWVMMAMKGPLHNWDDEYATRDIMGREAKAEANIEEIKARAAELGVWGTVDRLWENQAFQWSQGTYRSGVYLARAHAESDDTLLARLLTEDGDLYPVFYAYSQIYHFAILIFVLAALYRRRRESGFTFEKMIFVAIAGTVLFFIFWEANPKYLLPIMPFVLMMAADGMTYKTE